MCCSIIGYSSSRGDDVDGAAPILVRGLRRMEYRGYDSVGVATAPGGRDSGQQADGGIMVRKGTGKVDDVNRSARLDAMPGSVGIGHTRWATHGNVTDANAHPHPSSSGEIAIVHNGIITNFEEIKSELVQDGYEFRSETDSEVISNLLQKNYERTGSVKESMMGTVSRLQGEYAFVAMFSGGRLAAARLHKPLIIGVGKNDMFLSSDVLGFIEYTDEAVYVENGNMVIANGDMSTFEVTDFEGSPVKYSITKVSKEFGDAYKGDYAHFTLKEIFEQHETTSRAGGTAVREIAEAARIIRGADGVCLTGSGSSYNAALVAKHFFASHAKKSTEAVMSSEMQFSSEGMGPGSVLVAISQSGESADVLSAVRTARKAGCRIISVVNMMTSSLARQSDVTIGMNCGPEIGVAATKSFTSQLVVLYRIISQVAEGGRLSGDSGDSNRNGNGSSDITGAVPGLILRTLEDPTGVQKVAKELKDISDIYVLGRGVHYPIATEAALKIKELTYIHAEGIAGGELKHGPLALMDDSTYVIVINPADSTYEEMLTSAREIKARGARIIGISDAHSDVYDHWIKIPETGDVAGNSNGPLYAISEIIPIQLLAYYTALERNADPDYPRNLAKSVTVK